jgi:hypothetical protein
MQLDNYRPAKRQNVELGGQALEIGYSRNAWSHIHDLDGLHLQMELLYSCLVRKRVLTNGRASGLGQCHLKMDNGMTISFRPVVTQHCDIDAYGQGQALMDMPVAEGRKIRPRWLYIDYRKGEWCGDFGFA